MKEKKVTGETVLAEILKRPGAGEILSRHRLPCLHCPMSRLEMESLKIGEVAMMYGLDLNAMLKELNGKVKK